MSVELVREDFLFAKRVIISVYIPHSVYWPREYFLHAFSKLALQPGDKKSSFHATGAEGAEVWKQCGWHDTNIFAAFHRRRRRCAFRCRYSNSVPETRMADANRKQVRTLRKWQMELNRSFSQFHFRKTQIIFVFVIQFSKKQTTL